MREPRRLSLAQQYLWLRHTDPSGFGQLRPGRLVWTFDAAPTPTSRRYRLRLTLTPTRSPNIVVLQPDLHALANGRRLPHVYRQSPVELCLWLPRLQEWHGGLPVASTIVPWAHLWLLYFEEWLVSNDWQGGGEHPAARDAA
jgi:hypothetical protein